MKTKIISFAFALAFMVTSSAHAQVSDFDTAFSQRGAEARVSLSIPFGGQTNSPRSKPQLALVARQYRSDTQSVSWATKQAALAPEFTEARFSLTLSSRPELLLNDQVLKFDDDLLVQNSTLNALDTYDKGVLTVIGVSLAVIAGSIIIFAN